MKNNAHIFLPESTKIMSEVAQNAHFILSGFMQTPDITHSQNCTKIIGMPLPENREQWEQDQEIYTYSKRTPPADSGRGPKPGWNPTESVSSISLADLKMSTSQTHYRAASGLRNVNTQAFLLFSPWPTYMFLGSHPVPQRESRKSFILTRAYRVVLYLKQW